MASIRTADLARMWRFGCTVCGRALLTRITKKMLNNKADTIPLKKLPFIVLSYRPIFFLLFLLEVVSLDHPVSDINRFGSKEHNVLVLFEDKHITFICPYLSNNFQKADGDIPFQFQPFLVDLILVVFTPPLKFSKFILKFLFFCCSCFRV